MTFPDFWATYPHPKNRGSKAHAEKLYGRLSMSDKIDMLAGLGKYQAYLAENTWNAPMQAQRWLNKATKNWQSWIEAAEGEDGDISQIQRETEEIRKRNEQRQAAADEQWRDRYEKQFGLRPR